MDNLIKIIPELIPGLKVTLEVFFATLILSIPLGIVVALARLSKIKIISKISGFYVLILRGTPLLLQIIFIFFGLSLPSIGIVFDRFTATIIAFVLNYAAYFGEIFRAGLSSIDKGQYEGSEVLGLSPIDTFFRIILPQAVKRILPAVSNEVTTLIKDTSLVYIVGLQEILQIGKIASNRYASLSPLIVVGITYLLLIGILTKVFQIIEKRYNYYN
jgi:polar amino acid transport system permease protein